MEVIGACANDTVVLGFLGAVLLLGIICLGFVEVDAAFRTSGLQFSALVLLLPLSLLGNGALCAGLAVLSAVWIRRKWRRTGRWDYWSGVFLFGDFLALLLIIETGQVLEVVSLPTLHDLRHVMEASVQILLPLGVFIGFIARFVPIIGEMRQQRRQYKALMAALHARHQAALDQSQRETKLKADNN